VTLAFVAPLSHGAQAVNCSRTPDRVFREDSEPEPLASTLGYAAVKRAAEALVRTYTEARARARAEHKRMLFARCRSDTPTSRALPPPTRPPAAVRFAPQAGLPVVVLNPAEVYGARDTGLVTAGNLKAFLCDAVVLLPRCGGTSVCAVEDVAAACVAALTRGRPGERYILGGPNLSVEQLARTTLRLAGGRHARKPLLRLPAWLLLGVVRLLAAVRLPVPVEPGVLAFAVLYWYVDSAKAARELGYTARSAEDTLAPVVNWLRETGQFAP
jgi:hypothetical protein